MKLDMREIRIAMAAKAINAKVKFFLIYYQEGDLYKEYQEITSILLERTGETVDIRIVTGPFSLIKTRNVVCGASLI